MQRDTDRHPSDIPFRDSRLFSAPSSDAMIFLIGTENPETRRARELKSQRERERQIGLESFSPVSRVGESTRDCLPVARPKSQRREHRSRHRLLNI